MSRELVVAWELLDAVTRARQQMAAARPMIWERSRMPTADHTVVLRATTDGSRWRPSVDGDRFVVRVTLEVHLPDARRLTSCLDVIVAPDRLSVHPYLTLTDGHETLIWDGPTNERPDTVGLLEAVDAAARNLLRATMRVDFQDPTRDDIRQLIGIFG